MSDTDPKTTPKPSSGDAVHAVVRAGLGSIPCVGAAATELFNWVIKPPLERRRDEWMKEIGECLAKLQEDHGVAPAKLRDDDSFFDTVMQATHVALRNSQEEKRKALRNAILNSALQHAPDDSERQMFLQLIDRFTTWHLRVLDFFNDPPSWFTRHGKQPPAYSITSSLSKTLEAAYSELKGKEAFYSQVCNELDNSGLLGVASSLKTMMSADGWKASRSTERGKLFLRFISEPEHPD